LIVAWRVVALWAASDGVATASGQVDSLPAHAAGLSFGVTGLQG
jgi:hypothetical protein